MILVSCDEKNKVNKLSVRKQVLDYAPYLPQFTAGSENKHSLRIPSNPHYEDIIGLIQYIESLGSFLFNIKRIHWDTPLREWIPENDNEKTHLAGSKIGFSREYPSAPIEMPNQMLLKLIQNRDKLRELTIPMSFYREGINAHKSFQYINAFFNFYFFLEGLFSDGKYKKKEVKLKFKVSTEIRQAVEITIKSFHDPSYTQHLKKLDEFRIREQCEDTVDGIIDLIVEMRGILHHYSVKSTQKLGHPLNQQDFDTMSYLIMSISTYVAAQLITQKLGTPLEPKSLT